MRGTKYLSDVLLVTDVLCLCGIKCEVADGSNETVDAESND